MKARDDRVSPALAGAIMNSRMRLFGPMQIEKAFKIKVDYSRLPPIPFSRETLERAAELDHSLVFHPPGVSMRRIMEMSGGKTSDGRQLVYIVNRLAKDGLLDQPMRVGWRLTGNCLIDGSLGLDYIDQTRAIAEHLRRVIFKDSAMPVQLSLAIAQFEAREAELRQLLNGKQDNLCEQLSALEINRLCRETPAEVLWHLALCERLNGERLLRDDYTWTTNSSAPGHFIRIGFFQQTNGIGVSSTHPGNKDRWLGVRLSLS